MNKKKTIPFALLGLGKLGSGFYNAWVAKRERIKEQTGFDLELKKILIKNAKFKRLPNIDKSLLTTNIEDIIKDDSIRIAVGAIGGIEPTFSLIKKLIENKVHLVSANRILLASKMHELEELANSNNIIIHAEPSLGGGLPIISTLRRDLVATNIKTVTGIVSGTSNYILSEMTKRKISMHDVLKESEVQNMGESLSVIDYEGTDAAQKVSIIAAAAFGIDVNYLYLPAEGISDISLFDIQCAEEFGFEFKLLATIREHDDQFEIRVHPTLVPKHHPLISVKGEYNAFYINTDMIGNYMLYGKGVGIEASSSLILRDLIDIADKIKNSPKKTPYNLSWNTKSIMPIEEVETSYYLRFPCLNRPGVIGEIANILGEYKINIGSAHAEVDRIKGAKYGYVHIFIEKVREKAIRSALDTIKDLEIIQERIKLFRILEEQV